MVCKPPRTLNGIDQVEHGPLLIKRRDKISGDILPMWMENGNHTFRGGALSQNQIINDNNNNNFLSKHGSLSLKKQVTITKSEKNEQRIPMD